MPDANRPDAILMPGHYGEGENDFFRLKSIVEKARKILGVNMDAGERAHCRPMPAGQPWFCTRDSKDTILFPNDHPLAGRPRYAWAPRPGGLKVGTLVPEATMEVPVEQV